MPTSNMSLNEPSVGVTTGPTWATQTNTNWETIDTHDHTSGKGVQLTPSALNINADLEFNQNSASELKNVIFDSSVTAATTNYSVYQSGGNLYWRNGSGVAVQITDGSGINTSGGSISNMTGNSQVQFSGVNKSYTFKFDSTLTDGIAKLVMSDIQLYYYNAGSATTRSVNLKYLGSGTGANTLTVPDETGTLLSTATSFAGVINIATSSSNAAINLKPNGTGYVVVGNGSATGKLTSNGAYDLTLYTNSGTNSGSITIRDGADEDIHLNPHGSGKVLLGSGSGTGTLSSSGAYDLKLETNDGTNSGSITITDGANGNIDLTPHGTGEVNISKVDIDAGTIDGTDVTVGSSKTLDVSAGTLTTSTAQKQAISATAFASGTKMLFNQTSAPTGWTKDTSSNNNSALRVVTGSAGTGGTQDFTSAFGSTISVAISNAAVTLSDGQMPNHYHSSAFANASHATLRNYLSKTGDTNDGGFATDSKGSSNPHTHSNTLSGVGSSASTYNLAVKYVDVIIASKD